MPFSKATPESKPVELISRVLSWRPLRWGFAGVTVLLLLVGLFYAEENWRGKRTWAAYQRVLKAKGVEFNWHALAPPPVANGNNFAMTPFFAALFDYAPGTHTPRDMTAYNRTAGFAQTGAPYLEQRGGRDPIPAMFNRQRTDLAAGLQLYRKTVDRSDNGNRTVMASAVLGELAKFNPVLDELRAASRRPQSRFNFSYDEQNSWRMPQPHLPVLKRVSTVLTLRASAELALRNAAAAADDVRLIITLANSVRDEPFLGSQRARYVMLVNARQIIWEGLADHRWSDEQLRDFQIRLQELNLIRDVQGSIRLDQASVNELFGQLHDNPATIKTWRFGPGIWNGVLPYFFWMMPSGWMYQEQVGYHHSFEDQLLPALDTESVRIQPSSIYQAGHGRFPLWNHRVLADIFLQSLNSSLTTAALAQTGRNQTIVACALERYRLTNGQFPENLEALSPQCLATIPPDVFTGQPMKYRRTDDGRFQLYSIGWNAKDDGGKVVMNSDGKFADVTQGDWVWPQYPDD
jgi:hypothetical protein